MDGPAISYAGRKTRPRRMLQTLHSDSAPAEAASAPQADCLTMQQSYSLSALSEDLQLLILSHLGEVNPVQSGTADRLVCSIYLRGMARLQQAAASLTTPARLPRRSELTIVCGPFTHQAQDICRAAQTCTHLAQLVLQSPSLFEAPLLREFDAAAVAEARQSAAEETATGAVNARLLYLSCREAAMRDERSM